MGFGNQATTTTIWGVASLEQLDLFSNLLFECIILPHVHRPNIVLSLHHIFVKHVLI